jgi:hypothetical protein
MTNDNQIQSVPILLRLLSSLNIDILNVWIDLIQRLVVDDLFFLLFLLLLVHYLHLLLLLLLLFEALLGLLILGLLLLSNRLWVLFVLFLELLCSTFLT